VRGIWVIQINEANIALRVKKLRKLMNGKFNNISSADENKLKNDPVEALFKKL
jgi:hypothetical protein